MTIQVELTLQAQAQLAAQADHHGVAPETYAGTLLQELLGHSLSPSGRLSLEELETMLMRMAEGSHKLHTLPTSAFTRDSFYEDRI